MYILKINVSLCFFFFFFFFSVIIQNYDFTPRRDKVIRKSLVFCKIRPTCRSKRVDVKEDGGISSAQSQKLVLMNSPRNCLSFLGVFISFRSSDFNYSTSKLEMFVPLKQRSSNLVSSKIKKLHPEWPRVASLKEK